MASNLIIYPASLAKSVASAVAASSVGAKGQAGCVALSSGIGSSYRLRIRSGSTTVVDVVYQGALAAVNGVITLPAYATLSALIDATIASGWTCRIGKADDSAYVEGSVGNAASSATFRLTGNPDDNKGFATGPLLLRFDPEIDSGSSTDAQLLTLEYARAMTEQNYALPGNLNNYGYVRPNGTRWGQDPVNFPVGTNGGAQDDYRMYGASSIFLADTDMLGMWPWLMVPYNVANTSGNWRAQIGRIQWAFKLDSLSNPWLAATSPQAGRWRPLSGFTPNPPADDISPINHRVRSPWLGYPTGVEDSASQGNETLTNGAGNLAPRDESANGGGVSYKDIGISLSGDFQKVECNAWISLKAADSGFDPRRIKALALCAWGRLIPDNPAQAWNPAAVNVGLLVGGDTWGPSHTAGQRGIGWGRFIRLETAWRPAVFAVVDQTVGGWYRPAQMGQWLSANPPPFV